MECATSKISHQARRRTHDRKALFIITQLVQPAPRLASLYILHDLYATIPIKRNPFLTFFLELLDTNNENPEEAARDPDAAAWRRLERACERRFVCVILGGEGEKMASCTPSAILSDPASLPEVKQLDLEALERSVAEAIEYWETGDIAPTHWEDAADSDSDAAMVPVSQPSPPVAAAAISPDWRASSASIPSLQAAAATPRSRYGFGSAEADAESRDLALDDDATKDFDDEQQMFRRQYAEQLRLQQRQQLAQEQRQQELMYQQQRQQQQQALQLGQENQRRQQLQLQQRQQRQRFQQKDEGFESSTTSGSLMEELIRETPDDDDSDRIDIEAVHTVKGLMTEAFLGPLTISQQQYLIAQLTRQPRLLLYSGLTADRLPDLIESNQQVASEVLPRLALTEQFTEYLQTLLTLPLSINSMEVVHRLLTGPGGLAVPPDFLHLYIASCMRSCEVIEDRVRQGRQVRLVCVFIQSLLRHNVIDIRDHIFEIQAFCIQFSRHKEAAGLYRIIAEAQRTGVTGNTLIAGGDASGASIGRSSAGNNAIMNARERERERERDLMRDRDAELMAMAMGEYGGGRGVGGPSSSVTYNGNTAAYPGRHPYQNANSTPVQRGYAANPNGASGLGGGTYGGAAFAGGWG
ncbi:hypothetical protein BC938DRAFT_471287 [Jimgerdemannia flammicorona]|uniref:CCR4-NOT transcription complex subunit 11 n=1 Tax=Jimgerdemannia flammicorona TaxID=994334 RepID=A0A433Q8E1_9FUNG|nr:hypothetical protein BC938DRAFT_471287 [Jimgerdemannia flammicorona]